MSERLANRTSSVHRVPVEVLSNILLYAVTFYDPIGDLWNIREHLANLQDLRLVCCLWNNIMEGDGRFWTACSVRIGQDPFFGTGPRMEEVLPVLQRFFERSQSLPLTLSMSVSFHGRKVVIETFQPLVDFVYCFKDRWLSLSFTCLKPLTEAGLTWWLAFFRPLTTIDDNHRPATPPCYKSVRELSFETVYEEDAAISIEDFPVSQVFPNIKKLVIHLDTIKKGDILPQQLHGLHSLTYLRVFVDNLVDVDHRLPILHGILTELPQLQHLELDRLGVPPGDPFHDIPDIFLGDNTPLVHLSLTTLTISHAFNLPLFMFPIFPVLERLIVGNRFYGSVASYYAGRRPGPGSMTITTRGATPYYDKRWSSAQILENLMRMSPNRSNLLRTLILSDIGISEDDLFTLLFETSSLEMLHLKPPDPALCTGGRCLTRLFERSKTDSEAVLVLPRLQSLSIDTTSAHDEEGSGDIVDEVEHAFKEFVEDPRREKWGNTSRAGVDGREEGAAERYQDLQEAILYVDGEERYWRSS